MLNRIDLTEIEDSEDEDSNTVEPRKTEVTKSDSIAASSASPTFPTNDNHTVTPIAKQEERAEIRREETSRVSSNPINLMEGKCICRSILPSVSPETTSESESCNHSSDNNGEDEDVIEIIEESNQGSNPFLDFPHRREDCQRFDFTSHPERFCRLCYCYICDVPASKCTEWYVSPTSKTSHCLAKHSDTKSRLRRKSLQMRKNTLRPRKRLLPPVRHRSTPLSSNSGNHHRSAESTLPPKTEASSAATLVVSRTRDISKAIEKPIPKSPVLPLMRMRRSLRPRNAIQMPIRLRSSAGMMSSTNNSKKTKQKKSPLSSSVPPPNLSHDLFLPGKRTLPILPSATNQAGSTTPIDRNVGAKPSNSRKEIASPSATLKRKRSSNSPSREKISKRRNLPTHFPRAKRTPSSSKINGVRRKQAARTKTGKEATSANRRLPPSANQAIHRIASPTQSNIKTTPIRSSSHFTRSCGNGNSAKTPEVYGTLGAYWRGEPTKYAGVPYQKRTSRIISPEYVQKREEKSTPKVEDNHLPALPIDSTNSRIKRRKTMLPSSSSRDREVRRKSTRQSSAKRRILLSLSPNRNAAGGASIEESRKPIPEVVEKKEEEDLLPTTDAPEKQSITATLEGIVSYDADSRRYSILGTWYCPWSKSFPPQKFGLVRNLREGEKGPKTKGATLNGSFDGYCVVTTKSLDDRGIPSYHDRLVFESDVVLEFRRDLGIRTHKSMKTKPLNVHGFGSNKFGAFRICGKAQPCPRRNNTDCKNLYTIVLQKRYLPKSSTNDNQNATHTARRESRLTRSNSIFGKGTIIRKLFGNGNHYEGEVVGYDPIRKCYKIKYTDGNLEDYDAGDMKKYYKDNQRYSHTPYTAKTRVARKMLVNSLLVNDSV